MLIIRLLPINSMSTSFHALSCKHFSFAPGMLLTFVSRGHWRNIHKGALLFQNASWCCFFKAWLTVADVGDNQWCTFPLSSSSSPVDGFQVNLVGVLVVILTAEPATCTLEIYFLFVSLSYSSLPSNHSTPEGYFWLDNLGCNSLSANFSSLVSGGVVPGYPVILDQVYTEEIQ